MYLNVQDTLHAFDIFAMFCQQVTHEHIEAVGV